MVVFSPSRLSSVLMSLTFIRMAFDECKYIFHDLWFLLYPIMCSSHRPQKTEAALTAPGLSIPGSRALNTVGLGGLSTIYMILSQYLAS